MTIPTERTRAVLYARDFLSDLCNPKITPRVPSEVREQARRILRHYPSSYELDCVAETSPDWFGKPGMPS
jgi:hypothetical protein